MDLAIKSHFADLKKPFIVLLVIDPKVYQSGVSSLVSFLLREKKMSGIYLTVNKPSVKYDEVFRSSGVNTDELFFIDTISKMANPMVADNERVKYIATPNSLTQIAIAITTILRKPVTDRVFIVDSISTLLVYNKPDTVSKFLHFLEGKISMTNTSAVFIALKGETETEVQRTISQFVDKTIELKYVN